MLLNVLYMDFIFTVKHMREMKESGIEWIGQIPKEWETVKLKYVAPKIERGTAPDYTEDENMTRVVNQATFSKGTFDTSKLRFSTKPAELSRGLLKRGDTLVASTGGGVLGKTYYFDENEVYVADGHVTVIRPEESLAVSKFLHYFISVNYDTLNACMAEGSTNQTELQRELFCNMYFPSPNIIEQQAIVTFLDSKCAEIDALSSDIQSEIETLEAYKRSVITEAVTKGLDKNLPMKDSGIEWVGEVPEHWDVRKIKYTLFSRSENNNPIRSKNILSLTAKQGVIPLNEREGGGNKPKEDYSAYKLAYPNDIVMNSMNILSGAVGLSKYFGCVSPVYYMLRPQDAQDDVRYYHDIFQTRVFQKSLRGLGNGILIKESDNGTLNTIRMRIPLDTLGNVKIPVPPSDEQKEIADYIEKNVLQLDSILVQKQKQLSILAEYKKSLIYEYVTGKKEVPQDA